ncbi:MAG TPA: RNA pseudouridine synthase [Alphaproteobacteria bacterium]|nr:RNA pseudouridine synthase [Alphaproteobacteria bacterium]
MIEDFDDQSNENLIRTPSVPVEKAGIRADKWLAEATELSRSRLAALIEHGCVCQNGIPLSAADKKVTAGDVFEIAVPAPAPAVPQAQEIPLDVVYEDSDILVLNKAAGMVVHPAAGNYDGTLVNALLAHCRDSLSGIGGVARPGIVHRLDKETSGLLVIAKNDLAHQKLSEQFAVHSLERCYLALVWGVPNPLSGVIETQIGRSSSDRKKMAVLKSGGKRAETHYRVVKILAGGLLSLVECSLKTGRTHQVRVHMTSIGHPLIGDKVYGRPPKGAAQNESIRAAYLFDRQALHSYKMSFIHPKTNREMRFEIPLPPDMQAVVDSTG